MFGGRLTKPLGYFVSIANGFDTIGILDAFLDLEYDPRLRLRVGRFKTPFTYEFLVEPVQGLIVPERSLFFNNFGLNRDNGIMAYGRLANNTFDYAVGIFNGSRNGLLNRNNSQDVAAFINWKPFNNNQGSLLENFNIGGSVFAGNENNLPVPQTLRTAVATSGNAIIGVPFLTFNHNVRESGDRAFWDLHTAWFYRQLAVVAEWGSGFQDYALSSDMASRTHLPVQSWYVQAGYFLTGETRSGFGIVKPKSPFDIRKGQFGTGAIEPFLRYDMLNLGGQVFTNGLADPNSWTNNLYMTDVGVNWHLTQYLKIYFDWQHAVFGNPVVYAPSRLQKTSNMFMVRFQVYF
jgi:phosphate-selective porin OprO/OprP